MRCDDATGKIDRRNGGSLPSAVGTLSSGATSGNSLIATTNSSGTASVTLMLPPTKGIVIVTAQDQFALGAASVTFTETAN